MVLVKPFPGTCTNTVKHFLSPEIEKKGNLVTVHTGTNDRKSVNSLE